MSRRITVSLLLVLMTAATALPAQEDEEEVDATRISGRTLVLTVAEADFSPHGTFVHESGDYSIVFDSGEPVAYDGVDGESEPRPIEKVEIQRGRLAIYPVEGRVRNKAVRPVMLESGPWVNRRTGALFIVDEGMITKCKGLDVRG